MKRIWLLFFLTFVSLVELSAEALKFDYHVIPMPKEVVVDSSNVFVLSDGMGMAYDASDGEIWFSVDESNDADLGDHLTQSLKNNLTSDMVNGDWTKWRAKKWYKVGDFTFGEKDQTTRVYPGGAKAKYMMIVLHEGTTNNGMPVLCLTDMNLKIFNPTAIQ